MAGACECGANSGRMGIVPGFIAEGYENGGGLATEKRQTAYAMSWAQTIYNWRGQGIEN